MRQNRICFLAALLAWLGVLPCAVAAPSPTVTTNVVVVLTVVGKAEILRVGTRWPEPAQTNQVLYPDDQGRTYENSQMTLRMYDLSIQRIGENTIFKIGAPPTPKSGGVFNVIKGKVYFFHRGKPLDVLIQTPTTAAAIRGTEFALEQEEGGRTVLTMFDGEVDLTAADGQKLTLGSGDQGIVEPGKAPQKKVIAKLEALSAIQWCLYYPGVLDLGDLNAPAEMEQALAGSLAAYREGDLVKAMEAYPEGRQAASGAEKVYLSALLLGVGDVEKASALIDSVRTEMPRERAGQLAEALRTLVAAVTRQPAEAGTPSLATEWLAESYYQQSQANLELALLAARAAVEHSPRFGLGWARVAELEFSFGRIRAARAALDKSLELSPRNAEALALKGYLFAAENRIPEALAAFDHAIAVDGNLSPAWLGRGLCQIRRGDREAGLTDLETAAVLEPNRSLPRSYLGKGWSYAGMDEKAWKELTLAKNLDPQDPTPWLYSALLNWQQNQVNPAVADLEKSTALNDNRSVFRSRFMLDQDQSVRSANLANIYERAGMRDVGVREGARAVNYDYANYAAHLFLSDSYDVMRDPTRFNLRYETVWFNERLLANFLAPVGAATLSPYVGQQENLRLFNKENFGFSSMTDYRSDGQFREIASQYGNVKDTGYSLDVDYQHNSGVRPNNKLSRLEWYTTLKQQLTPQDSVLLMTKYEDFRSGDNFQYYDPASARANFSYNENQAPILMAGYHREWNPGMHTLVMAGRLVNDQEFKDQNAAQTVLFRDQGAVVAAGNLGFDVRQHSELEVYGAEVNQIFQTERQLLVVGGRYQGGDIRTRSILFNPQSNGDLFRNPAADILDDGDVERFTGYGYYTLELPAHFRITGGAAVEELRFPENFRSPPISDGEETVHRVNPKAALVWDPFSFVTFRGIYAKSLGGVSLDESFRLEPTQLAGFGQAFRSIIPESLVGSVAAPDFETWGAAMDWKLPTRTYFSVQGDILKSRVRETVGMFDFNDFNTPIVPSSTRENLDFKEQSIGASLNQLVGDEWSFGAQYRFSRAELNTRFPEIPLFLTGSSQFDRADLQQARAYGLFNHPSGFFASAESEWYWQHNAEASSNLKDDAFAQVNLYAGYRFPRQHVTLTFGVLNVGDQDYRLNPLNYYYELPRERVFFTRLLINF